MILNFEGTYKIYVGERAVTDETTFEIIDIQSVNFRTYLFNDNGMRREALGEHAKEVLYTVSLHPQYQEHGAEEGDHFPHGHKDVGEVARVLQFLLHPAEGLHETWKHCVYKVN